MPVLTKKVHQEMLIELINRYDNLKEKFSSRSLTSAREGVKGHGSWIEPDNHCATLGSSLELSIAVEDFKTILAEIKKLK